MTSTLLYRFGALCGAFYVVLAILASDVLGNLGPDSTATKEEIGAWFRENPATTRDWALAYLEVVALLAFLTFVAFLGWFLRRADGDRTWLPGAAVGAGLVSAAVKIGSGPAMFAVMWRADDGLSDELAAVLVDMNGAAFVLTWALDALMLAAAGAVIVMTRCAPRWLGWSALAIAGLSMIAVATPSAPIGFMFALLWFVVAGVTLAWRGAAELAAMPPRPATA